MALGPAALQHLDRVAEALVDDWRVFVEDAISQGEVAAGLADVTGRVRAAGEGAIAADVGVASPLVRRIVALLRRRIIQQSELLDPTECLPLLRAVEDVAASLEPRWSEHFQDRMAGPSGLDLIVEVAHDLRSPLTSILFLAENDGAWPQRTAHHLAGASAGGWSTRPLSDSMPSRAT